MMLAGGPRQVGPAATRSSRRLTSATARSASASSSAACASHARRADRAGDALAGLPTFTTSSPGASYTPKVTAVASLVLWGVFGPKIQHRDYFRRRGGTADESAYAPPLR